jgi:hypothetical protein
MDEIQQPAGRLPRAAAFARIAEALGPGMSGVALMATAPAVVTKGSASEYARAHVTEE